MVLSLQVVCRKAEWTGCLDSTFTGSGGERKRSPGETIMLEVCKNGVYGHSLPWQRHLRGWGSSLGQMEALGTDFSSLIKSWL